jgi:hypothetical protein
MKGAINGLLAATKINEIRIIRKTTGISRNFFRSQTNWLKSLINSNIVIVLGDDKVVHN